MRFNIERRPTNTPDRQHRNLYKSNFLTSGSPVQEMVLQLLLLFLLLLFPFPSIAINCSGTNRTGESIYRRSLPGSELNQNHCTKSLTSESMDSGVEFSTSPAPFYSRRTSEMQSKSSTCRCCFCGLWTVVPVGRLKFTVVDFTFKEVIGVPLSIYIRRRYSVARASSPLD